MKRLLAVVLSTLLCTSAATAAETEEISMERLILVLSADDKSNNVNPTGFIPFYWNSCLFSGVGYETGSGSSVSSKASFAPSTFHSIQRSNHLWLNLISYQERLGIFHYSVGAAYSYRKIDRDEFGYFNESGVLVSITNETELELVRPGLSADIATREIGGILSLRLGGYVYPFSTLGTKQTIDMVSTSLVPQTASGKKRTSQDLSYRFTADAHVKTGTFVDFSFRGRYEHLPLKYTVLTPFSIAPGNYNFIGTDIKSEYTSLRFDTKVLLPQLNFHGIDPMLGFGYEKVKNTLSLDITNAPERSTQTYFAFGFEKLF